MKLHKITLKTISRQKDALWKGDVYKIRWKSTLIFWYIEAVSLRVGAWGGWREEKEGASDIIIF